jgi:hypothetical protein
MSERGIPDAAMKVGSASHVVLNAPPAAARLSMASYERLHIGRLHRGFT